MSVTKRELLSVLVLEVKTAVKFYKIFHQKLTEFFWSLNGMQHVKVPAISTSISIHRLVILE